MFYLCKGVAFWHVFGAEKYQYSDNVEVCNSYVKNPNCTVVQVQSFEIIEKTFYNVLAVAFQMSLSDDDKMVKL